MLFDFFLFPLSIFLILSIGCFFEKVVAKLIGFSGQLTDDIGLKGFLGIFFIGILGVLANFFVPLSSAPYLALVLVVLIFGVWQFSHQINKIPKLQVIVLASVAIMFVPLASFMMPGYDGGLYHLPHQLWLRQEQITIGLANFSGRFGFSSVMEYVNATLWIDQHFKILSYVFAAFGVFFLTFLANQTRINNGPTLALVLGISVNLSIFSGQFNWFYTLTDIPAGFLFTTVFIYGFAMINSNETHTRKHWAVFSSLTLFAILSKPSTIFLLLWCIYTIVHCIQAKSTELREVFHGSWLTLAFGLVWLVRSILVSGCFLFPAKLTCLDVSWSAAHEAKLLSNLVTAWARHPNSGLYSLSDFSWFQSWWFPHYKIFILCLLITGVFICLISLFISARAQFKPVNFKDSRYIAAVIFSISTTAIWFWTSPTPRLGIGPLTILMPVLFTAILGKTDTNKNEHLKRVIATFFLAIVLFRSIDPSSTYHNDQLTNFNPMPVGGAVKETEVTTSNGFGTKPIVGDQCWVQPECAPGDRPNIQTFFGLKVFLPNFHDEL